MTEPQTCPNPCAADQLLADQGPADPDGPITPADIQQVTRHVLERREQPAAPDTPEALQSRLSAELEAIDGGTRRPAQDTQDGGDRG